MEAQMTIGEVRCLENSRGKISWEFDSLRFRVTGYIWKDLPYIPGFLLIGES